MSILVKISSDTTRRVIVGAQCTAFPDPPDPDPIIDSDPPDPIIDVHPPDVPTPGKTTDCEIVYVTTLCESIAGITSYSRQIKYICTDLETGEVSYRHDIIPLSYRPDCCSAVVANGEVIAIDETCIEYGPGHG